ncbi:hypothetical protein V5F29_00640 [Xanthobacter aminoxidans]|jgi:hypothetical protein|uniref:hypothetical protein n=1 Tax=Xanthobacter aminoxidans TaxID=186280 RepID=UPI0037280442
MPLIRTLAAVTVASLSLMAPAMAETRIFLIDNSDGSSIDSCLASGAPCGQKVAEAWCRTHAYTQVIDFGRVAVPASAFTPSSVASPATTCTGPLCPETVAITCSR